MRIRLLGTGAADGIPAFHGDDAISRFAREHGGKDVRTRSAAIIDDTLQIDLPPDIYAQLRRENLCACEWFALLFTHSDEDHCAISEIQYSMIPFTANEFLPYPIYANATVAAKIRQRYPEWPIELHETESFQCYEIGPYRLTPIRATHTPGEDCHNLIVQRAGQTLLYATDTGIWCDETWAYLRQFKLDLIVLECTDGFDPTPYEGHLDIKECIMVVDRLRSMKVLKEGAQVVTTHHSVRGMARHCDLEKALLPHGITPGYDGMVVEIGA